MEREPEGAVIVGRFRAMDDGVCARPWGDRGIQQAAEVILSLYLKFGLIFSSGSGLSIGLTRR